MIAVDPTQAASPAPKHGLAAGDAGRPARADWTIDQDWASYRAEEHATWHTLYQRQTALLPGRACDEFLAGLRDLPMAPDRIPDFERLSEVLMQRTGWQVVAVPGLVPDEVFFEHLANRRFPAGQFIRRPDQLDYLEEPDVFHDVFGHVPMLMNPVMADFVQAYGQGGLRARSLGALDMLARVYWYTVEFGLVRQADGLRIYGAGIVSSRTETRYSLESPLPQRVRFALERVMRSQYKIDDFQQTYFVLDDLSELLQLAQVDFAPLYERNRSLPSYLAGEKVEGDLTL
ncbi:phenylalanine 4-monooxygenase [Ideonella sp.]|uniref:phenylalanine 4-monooxygenase n=1 Tax=Ideonella sp. TaxID=1929293 RepID=UPI003BB7CDEC